MKRLDRKTIYSSRWINLYIDKVQTNSGKVIDEYHYLDYPKESVVIIGITQLNEILLLESFRYITNSIEIELPAGYIEFNESIEFAALREFREETAMEINNIECMYSYYPSNGMSNQKVHIVKGDITSSTGNNFDKDEVKQTYYLSISQIQTLIQNQEILDGVTLIALTLIINQLNIKKYE